MPDPAKPSDPQAVQADQSFQSSAAESQSKLPKSSSSRASFARIVSNLSIAREYSSASIQVCSAKIDSMVNKLKGWTANIGQRFNRKTAAKLNEKDAADPKIKEVFSKFELTTEYLSKRGTEAMDGLKTLEKLSKVFNLPYSKLMEYDLNGRLENGNNEDEKSCRLALEYLKKGGMEGLKTLEIVAKALELPLFKVVEVALNDRLEQPNEEIENNCKVALQYIKERGIQQFEARANLTFGLSLIQILKYDLSGELEKAEKEAEERCKAAFEKLDVLYKSVKGEFLVQDMDGAVYTAPMSPKDLELLKKVIKFSIIFFVHAKFSPNSDTFTATAEHRIVVKMKGESIEILSLFGKIVGKGGAGTALHTVDLLTGEYSKGEEAVLKTPHLGVEEEILREVNRIKKIHGNKKILGIQNPIRLVTAQTPGGVSYSHLSPRYQTDLSDILEPTESKKGDGTPKKRILSKEDRFSLTYQLLHGLCHMHQKDITHGDIKPGNLFCDFVTEDPNTGPLLYVSDFGSSIDHSESNAITQKLASTLEFRPLQDIKAAQDAQKAKNLKLFMDIEKKAEVFAACSVICSYFTNELPYEGVPGKGSYQIKSNLEQHLIDGGLSQATAQLIIRGLNTNYKERPDMKEIFDAIKDEITTPDIEGQRKITAERMAALLARSEPFEK